MIKLNDVIDFVSGSPQFRISETMDLNAPLYTYYSQTDLQFDLIRMSSKNYDNKQIRTYDEVNTLCEGDVVFSLISGSAAMVTKEREGYLYTQNYIKLVPKKKIDSKYLIYILNEDRDVQRQFAIGLQGSQVMKYTLKQLRDLELKELPSLEVQEAIGDVYLNQVRLQALRDRVAKYETIIVLRKLEEAIRNVRT